MFQRILVPLDGSERAELAIPLAMRLAHASQGSLFFLRVVDTLHEGQVYSPLATAYLQEMEERERVEAMDYLAEKTATQDLAGIEMHCAVTSGSIPSSLLQVIQQERIDLVVLCSHGYTGFKRWVLGSVAQKVVRQSPVPVLLVRAQNTRLQDKMGVPVRAVIALDGSSFAEAALLPAARLVAALSSPAEGELLLLHVMETPTQQEERECRRRGLDIDLRQAILCSAKEALQAARTKLEREFSDQFAVRVSCSVIEDGDTAHALIQAAELGTGLAIQQAHDLLALTTHGRSGIQRWVLGSVTERILQGSTLPVFVVHPPEIVSPPLTG